MGRWERPSHDAPKSTSAAQRYYTPCALINEASETRHILSTAVDTVWGIDIQ